MDPQKGTDEYFIVENRWPGNSYDREMSDSGLAVWHVIEKPEIYGSQIPPTPPGFDQASWEANWSTVSAGDWGRRAIRMIKPVWNTFDDSQALWDGSDPATGYDLLANNPDPQKASLRWADGTPSGFAIENIPSAAATMQVFIDFKLTVDTLVDENDGDFSAGDVSLREAIALSKAGGTIDFASSLAGGTITLNEGELAIDKNLTINGLGADKLTVSGNNASQVFNISDGDSSALINVEIDGLTIADGLLPSVNATGAGIRNDESLKLSDVIVRNNKGGSRGTGIGNFGFLKISESVIRENSNNFLGGVGGAGGIANFSGATLEIDSSTISDNVSAKNGSGIVNNGILRITNSTISENTINAAQTGFGGAGIFNASDGKLSINNSTISDNKIVLNNLLSDRNAFIGGGVRTNSGEVSIANTIVAGNTISSRGGVTSTDVFGSFNSSGYNLIGDSTDSTGFNGAGDQVGTSTNPINPLLGPLQDNGGPTRTRALSLGSPAINAGDPNFTQPPEFDQRGTGFPRIQGGRVDIGAFEAPLPTGSGGRKTSVINRSDSKTIADFGGIGTGSNPSAAVLAEVDTLKFVGTGLTARNLLLTQNGADLEIAFEGVADTKVTLENFALENLENLTRDGGATVDLGNILFNGENSILDSFDVVNADFNQPKIFNRNTATFLNDLNNDILGFNKSNDVINGQGGDDIIDGLSGNDVLRGGEGKDLLRGGTGSDILVGGSGDDFLDLGADRDIDTVVYRSGDGSDTVRNFNRGKGGDKLDFQNIAAIDVVVKGSSTSFRLMGL